MRKETRAFTILLTVAFGFILNSCKKNELSSDSLLPAVKTMNVRSISQVSAVSGCNVITTGRGTITTVGICYDISPDPTITNSVVSSSGTIGNNDFTMQGLQPETTYYVRAFATNNNGTSYGETISFQTPTVWREIGTSVVSCINYGPIVASGDDVYMHDGPNRVFHSHDNGDTWQAFNTGLTQMSSIGRLAISGQSLYIVENSGRTYASALNSPSWKVVTSTFTNTSVYYNLTSVLIKDNIIYVGSQYGGVYKATINTTGWSPAGVAMASVNVQSLANKDNTLLAATYGGGIYASYDNGDNWSYISTGLSNRNVYTIAVNGNDMYAGTDGGSFLSTNNGGQWSLTNANSSYNYFSGFGFRGSTVYALSGTGYLSSTDKGTTWDDFSEGLPSATYIAPYAPAMSNKYIFALGVKSSTYYIFRRVL